MESSKPERVYVESNAEARITARWLSGAVALLGVAFLGHLFIEAHTLRQQRNRPPYVVRIDTVGRADAVNPDGFRYTPQAPEVKYFLYQFLTLYLTRDRYTIGRRHGGLADSLYFFDEMHRRVIMEEWQSSQMIKKFQTDPTSPQINIDCKQARFGDLSVSPYQAWVDFEEQISQNGDISRKMFTASVVFEHLKAVPDEYIGVNPLGFMVDEIKVDAVNQQ